MRIIIFGATGMVGQGVLRECVLDPDVTQVLVVGRTRIETTDQKVVQQILPNLFKLDTNTEVPQGYDGCFFCLGVSSVGLFETQYAHWTYDLTLSIAKVLAPKNPAMTFIYVSGQGTDSTERGRSMWARVKGKTENALQRLPFKAVYHFRPALIQPLHGIQSRTPFYRWVYSALSPLLSWTTTHFPGFSTTTEQVGRAMLHVAKTGAPKTILESRDINLL